MKFFEVDETERLSQQRVMLSINNKHGERNKKKARTVWSYGQTDRCSAMNLLNRAASVMLNQTRASAHNLCSFSGHIHDRQFASKPQWPGFSWVRALWLFFSAFLGPHSYGQTTPRHPLSCENALLSFPILVVVNPQHSEEKYIATKLPPPKPPSTEIVYASAPSS